MTLNTLNLNKNSIGNDGVKRLADVLKDNVTLITLILSNNLIGDDGAKHLAESIQNDTKLITLNLENNLIGDGGAQNNRYCFKHEHRELFIENYRSCSIFDLYQ
ncbi:unnamed protein product [Rotaria magnacalcarata]|nr:unnamed protein product [Rotaria magnacalcarata]